MTGPVPKPLVTISIPSYNHGRWLAEAIESALAQTYPNVELVIVDDGSSDDSLTIAQRYAATNPHRVRVVTHPGGAHRGISATLNRGVEEARGIYWGGLPADDILSPDKIERQVEQLEANPALVFVYGYTRAVDAHGRPIDRHSRLGVDISFDPSDRRSLLGEDISGHPRPLELMLRGNRVPGVSALVRREALVRLVPGLFRECLIYSDWDLWIRLVALGAGGFLPRVVAQSRIHGGNTSWESDEELARRRALDVLRTIEADADEIGGGFDSPRIRATLRLELALLCRGSRMPDEAERWAAAALAADPSLAGDSAWVRAWLLGHVSRYAPPDDLPAWMLEHAPAPLRRSLSRTLAALRLEQEARAAERRGERRSGWALAWRSLRLRPSGLVDPPFLRLLVKLAIGRRPTAIARRGLRRLS